MPHDDPVSAANAPVPEPVSNDALDRYLAGCADPTDQAYIEALRASNRDVAMLVIGFTHRRARTTSTETAADARERITRRLGGYPTAGARDANQLQRVHRGDPSSHRPWHLRRWRLGAASIATVAVVVAMAGSLRHYFAVETMSPVLSYATKAAERKTFPIAGGNFVTLAPRTTLRIQGGVATLTGEALFTIVHRHNAPFVVRAGTTTTRVLGTTFDVRRYADEAITQVAVVDGRVETRQTTPYASRALVIAAGHVAHIDDSAATVSTDIAHAVQWTNGPLHFDHVPLTDVLATVSRWYGYEFRLAGRDSDRLREQHITVILDERSVHDAVQQFGYLLNTTATFDSTGHGMPVITLHLHSPMSPIPSSSPASRHNASDAYATPSHTFGR